MASPQIRIIVGELADFTVKVIKAITLETTSELQKTTPVDVGWARANWVPSIGMPDDSPGDLTGDARQKGLSAQRSRQQAGIGRVLAAQTIGAVFITNNVPYIVKLNQGSSTKAPAAFVQAAISKGVQQAERRFG